MQRFRIMQLYHQIYLMSFIMRLIFKISLVLLISLQIFGCATQTFKSNATLEQRKTISILYAQGGGVTGFVSGMLMPIGTKKSVNIVTVDGTKMTAKKNSKNKEYWLSPGIHKIEVKCTIQIDSRYYDGKEILEYDFIAGKEYLLNAFIPNNSLNKCSPNILVR